MPLEMLGTPTFKLACFTVFEMKKDTTHATLKCGFNLWYKRKPWYRAVAKRRSAYAAMPVLSVFSPCPLCPPCEQLFKTCHTKVWRSQVFPNGPTTRYVIIFPNRKKRVKAMFEMPETITYALPELIGNTDLFVGRQKEFDYFLGVWYNRLIGNMAQSQAIVARRKKGKTAFLQRLFNILWSCPESKVIPFYYSIQEEPITRASFAKEFFFSTTRYKKNRSRAPASRKNSSRRSQATIFHSLHGTKTGS